MQSYHHVHVQLPRKDRQKVASMLSKGQESARVLRRASILRLVDGGQKAVQVAANIGVAPKTVRAVADHRHGVWSCSTGCGAVERGHDCRGSGEAKAGTACGPGDDSHPSPEPRIETVAGKKAGASRT